MNLDFKKWFASEFSVSIPSQGTQIVSEPAEMWDLDSQDSFCRWLSKIQ